MNGISSSVIIDAAEMCPAGGAVALSLHPEAAEELAPFRLDRCIHKYVYVESIDCKTAPDMAFPPSCNGPASRHSQYES